MKTIGIVSFVIFSALSDSVLSVSYADPTTRLVSVTGTDYGGCSTDPCKTIQYAIDQAIDGDTIKISGGIYSEKLRVLSRNDILIDGADPVSTIIQGDNSATQVGISSSTNITISNLTVRNGGDSRFSQGGGIQVFGGQSPTSANLINLILLSNEAVNGAAIAVERDAEVNIINSLIHNNSAANAAGAVLVGIDSKVTLESTTVANNLGGYLAGGIVSESRTLLSIRNSIIWGNNLQQIATFQFDGTEVSFSDVQGGYQGSSNININPLFESVNDENYRLSVGSPAIDSGSNNTAPLTDLDGKSRPIDGDKDGTPIVDMGAYEFGSDTLAILIDIKPGSNKNPVNPGSKGRLPVAILTTEDFDASTVDASTVQFGPSGATPVRYRLDDVDDDGDWDVMLKFNTQETGIACGDTEATLMGQTFGGIQITSMDSVKTVGCE